MDQLNDAPGLSGPSHAGIYCARCGEQLIVQSIMLQAELRKIHSLPPICDRCLWLEET